MHPGKLNPDSICEIVTAYDAERGSLPVVGESFRAGDIVPSRLGFERRATWIASAAVMDDQVLGYCVLELGFVDASRCASLFEQMGFSLHSVALLRAMVEEETRRERAERARLENELALAARIQTGILPRHTTVPGLLVASRMLPATEVGGDYFDVIPTPGGAWFAIGDVSGHGVAAGLVMLMTQSIVAAVTEVEPDCKPSVAWNHLNRVLYQNVRERLQQDEHATLTLLRYTGRGRFTFAGAHEDIIVIRASGMIEALHTPGIWTGITPTPAPDVVRDSELVLGPGDTLLLYTDGVIEAANSRGELFGIERLLHQLEGANARSPDELVEHVLEAVQAWESQQRDDITLLALRYTGEAATASGRPSERATGPSR
ncbi:MAG: PP2C family protein-serine/threonine phosphatase [Polyangiaceae bacterium]